MSLSQPGMALVSIVGAGPGDPELITIKGLKAIEKADVILYDALAPKALLDYAPPNCIKLFVGKRKGRKEFEQDAINQMMADYAIEAKHVVRLKGGDSYVFGRGHEELEFLLQRGIPVEVIPGITSAIAAPASVGIPLTKRGVNEGFMVVTGALSNGEVSHDIRIAATTSSTLVILMGLTHLEEIARIIAAVRSPHEPMAVIQNATTSLQQHVVGDASNIFSKVQEKRIETPAVIVIGRVVAESIG